MGFRSDGKTLHPTVQRAVYFNDALIAAQKQRVEYEALLATIQTAIANGEDLGQYLMSVGDAVGREMLLSSLGLGGRDANTQASLEQNLLADRAELQTIQQNLGPNHPEVLALAEKVRLTEQFLGSAQERINQRVAELGKSQLGPWLVQMVQQKLDESRKEEQILKARFEEARTEAINLSGQLAQIEMLERDVKRLNDMNDVLLNQIASLDLKQNGQDVRVAVIEEPVVSTTPVSPRLSIVALLAVLGGLGVALGLVTLLDALDDRFRSVEEMQSRLGLPLLTMVQQLEPPESAGLQALVTHATPTSAASESFRTLRTALTLTHPDARQIVVTSAEPGDGKTTTLANLAVCYAQADKRTLLIDADLRRPGLTGLMNMRGPHGLSEVLRSEVDIGQMAPAAHPPLRHRGAGHPAFRPAAQRSGGVARQSAVLATAGLGGNGLRPDPHRQPAHPGHHRHGDHRPAGRRRDPGRAAGQEPPPPGDARRGTARPDEDSRAGAGRQSDRLRRRPRLLRLSRLRIRIRHTATDTENDGEVRPRRSSPADTPAKRGRGRVRAALPSETGQDSDEEENSPALLDPATRGVNA